MSQIARNLRPVMFASALALIAGCESLYEGPSRNAGNTLHAETLDRPSNEPREADRATYASAEQQRTTAEDHTKASNSGAAAAGAAGGTRSTREGNRTRFSICLLYT